MALSKRSSVFIADAESFPGGSRKLAYELKVFHEAGFTVSLGNCVTEDEVIQQGQAKDAILLVEPRMKLTERTFQSLPQCKVVLRYGVGVGCH